MTSLPPRVRELVLFGRLDPEPGRAPYAIPADGVRIAPLPYYRSAQSVPDVLRAMRGSVAAFDRELRELDAVWIFGPSPMSLLFALIARVRRVPLVLGVRQDYPEYVRNRLPSRRWIWAAWAAHLMEGAFRLLARRAPTIALGDVIAAHYAGGAAPVLSTGFSLVSRAELREREAALAADWEGERIAISVGRLDAEKNPLLLVEIAAQLHAADPRWRLRIVGDGALRGAVEARIAELGIADAVEMHGEVTNGDDLWDLLRGSHAFLHVSHTEGLPQVLLEAHAAGIPIVATAVGGVAAALRGGELGLLMGPDDAPAAVAALERLAADRVLREWLICEGLDHAREESLEAQLDRISAFLGGALPRPSAAPAAPGAAGAPPVSAAKRAKRAVSGVLRSGGATRAVGALDRLDRGGDGLVSVLMYHRVEDPEGAPSLDPALLSTTPQEFEQQIDHVAARRPILSLEQLLAVRRGEAAAPKGAVLLTVDDAYRDFADNVWPVLRRKGLPVTLFVPTGYPGDPERAFWWDRIHWAVASTARSGIVETPAGALDLSSDASKAAACRAVRDWVWATPDEEAMAGIDTIVRELEAPESTGSVLGWDELRRLREEGVTLGAHSQSHPRLDQIPLDRAVDEVVGSIADLRAEVGEAPPAVAFPRRRLHERAVRAPGRRRRRDGVHDRARDQRRRAARLVARAPDQRRALEQPGAHQRPDAVLGRAVEHRAAPARAGLSLAS